MKKITPSEALEKLKLFNDRIARLESNDYSNARFRTSDLNKLKRELRTIIFYYSIAVFNKNQTRANEIVKEAHESYKIGFKIRDKEIFKI